MNDLQPLLDNKAVQRLFALYAAHDFTLRIVGGAVRDALLGRMIKDIDLASDATPEQSMTLLQSAGIKTIPTGLAHGTITAVVDGRNFEITTLRRDTATDGRHAVVVYTNDWKQDAARRDLTINGLSVDQHGKLFDYFSGVDDIAHKNLRFIGDAKTRMREDYLRLLRLFRFASVLNWDVNDNALLQTCADLAVMLQGLSKERILQELYLLLAGTGAKRVIRTMHDHGILSRWLDRVVDIDHFNHLYEFETTHGLLDPWRRVMALGLQDVTIQTREQKKRQENINRLSTMQSTHEMLYFVGIDAVIDHACLQQDVSLLHAAQAWPNPTLPVSAQDLITRFTLSGANLGAALHDLELKWLASDCTMDHADLLDHAAKIWLHPSKAE